MYTRKVDGEKFGQPVLGVLHALVVVEKIIGTRQSIVIAHLNIQHALAICSRFAVFDGHYDSDAPPGWRATKVRLPHRGDCQ